MDLREGFRKFAGAASAAANHAAQAAAKAAQEALAATEQAGKKLQGSIAAMQAAQQAGQEVLIAGKTMVIEQLLAEGGFGSVYLAHMKPPMGQTVSASTPRYVIKKMYAQGSELVQQLTGEVRLTKALQHPHIVKVLAAETKSLGDGVQIYVVMEYCSGGHMLSRINRLMEDGCKPLQWGKVLEYLLPVAKAVAYLHSQTPPITHRDLKFENVLIASDGTLRLCDFGSASTHQGAVTSKADRLEQEDAITRFTTPHFRAPEMVDLYSGLPLDTRSDVWALGCLLYGLTFYKHPFQETGTLAILAGRYRLPFSPAYPPCITSLIRQCLKVNPAERPTAAAIVSYVERCLEIGRTQQVASGVPTAWPPIEMSGGGAVPTLALPTPTPAADGHTPLFLTISADGDSIASTGRGSVSSLHAAMAPSAPLAGEVHYSQAASMPSAEAADVSPGAGFQPMSGNAGSGGGGSGGGMGSASAAATAHYQQQQGAARHSARHPGLTTAADIAAQLGSAAASTGKSNLLQARLAKRGGHGPAPLANCVPAAAPAAPAAPLVSQPQQSPRTAAAGSSDGFDDIFGGFGSGGGDPFASGGSGGSGTSSSGNASTATLSRSTSAHQPGSSEFDLFSSSGSGAVAAAAGEGGLEQQQGAQLQLQGAGATLDDLFNFGAAATPSPASAAASPVRPANDVDALADLFAPRTQLSSNKPAAAAFDPFAGF